MRIQMAMKQMPIEGELNGGGILPNPGGSTSTTGMGLRMKNPGLIQKQPEMYDLGAQVVAGASQIPPNYVGGGVAV